MSIRCTRLVLIVALAAIPLAAPASAHAGCSGGDQSISQQSVDGAQEAIRCLINKQRDRGMRNLRQRDSLEAAAQYHATDMAVKGYFSHDAPDGSSSFDRAVAFGYMDRGDEGGTGEVIAGGTGGYTPAEAVRGWMSSGPHRRVLLSRRFRHIGVGVASANGEVMITVDVGHH